MREKVLDYLKKPTKKLFDELTSMEQKYVANQEKADTPDTAKEKKPK